MAEFTASSGAEGFHDASSATGTSTLVSMTNAAGALVSLALVIGIGVWGYKLLVRDVTGIPVVRAASGEMRVRPEDPGGQLAQHQGLSVNEVAASGAAAPPADRLMLAPQPVSLEPEDAAVPTPLPVLAPADEPVEEAQEGNEDLAAALSRGEVDDIVAELTRGVAPLAPVPPSSEETSAAVEAALNAAAAAEESQVAELLDAPGLRQSYRPKLRPAVRADAPAVAAETPVSEEVDAASLPVGTRLAQLGAFDSAEVARTQWGELQTRFDAYMNGKTRIVQKATSGGRTFYRLRAMGFEDIADARRFCAALVAENADCIPVVTR